MKVLEAILAFFWIISINDDLKVLNRKLNHLDKQFENSPIDNKVYRFEPHKYR